MSPLRLPSQLMSGASIRKLGRLEHILVPLQPSASQQYARSLSSPRLLSGKAARAMSLLDFEMEAIFISVLVQAGSCNSRDAYRALRKSPSAGSIATINTIRRHYKLQAAIQSPSAALDSHKMLTAAGRGEEPSREEYMRMVDQYRATPLIDSPVPGIKMEAFTSLGPEEQKKRPLLPVCSNSQDHEAIMSAMRIILDDQKSLDEIYESYRALPTPGVAYLDRASRNALLKRLGVLYEKGEKDMMRYLAVLEDMKKAGFSISKSEWTTAMHLAGRCFRKVTSLEVEAALTLWKTMEQEAGIKGDTVTFNILFDVATKAGQFALADMILKEMTTRQLQFSRFTYVGLIYYYGVKGDGDGVRSSYENLVNAHHIVDTPVLNCVIMSLLEAREFTAAMHVYERMKIMSSNQKSEVSANNDRKKSKSLGKAIEKLTKASNGNQELMRSLQEKQSLAPNQGTYTILVSHHVSRTGELHPISGLLDDMHAMGVPLHGRLFVEIFRGFAKHGNKPYTSWTKARLLDVWEGFRNLTGGGMEDIFVAKRMIIWIIRAFDKCFGRTKTLEIWEELKIRWKRDDRDEKDFSESILMESFSNGQKQRRDRHSDMQED